MADSTRASRQRRAALRLVLIVAVVLLVAAVTVALIAQLGSAPPRSDGPAEVEPPVAPPAEHGAGGWDLATQQQIATRPMVALPPQATQPQRMSTQTAGPALAIPKPDPARWAPEGYPSSPKGALGRLAALNEVGMVGGNPADYARHYRAMSLPGAPAPEFTGLHSLLTSMRQSAGIAPTGMVPGLAVNYELTHGQIKGTSDDGRYVVACVLGQLSVDYQGHTLNRGVGDCQALRWTGQAWRISPGVLPAPAPSAWPGSDDALRAGYQELELR